MSQNFDNIIKITLDAIKESGKSFDKIDKQAVLSFLQGQGIPSKELRESIYTRIKEMSNITKVQNSVRVSTTPPNYVASEDKNEVPAKQPRKKNVFGPIKRLV